jgi:hypothetical protein
LHLTNVSSHCTSGKWRVKNIPLSFKRGGIFLERAASGTSSSEELILTRYAEKQFCFDTGDYCLGAEGRGNFCRVIPQSTLAVMRAQQ